MIGKLTKLMEERLEKVLTKMESGKFYSWDKFCILMDLHVPQDGNIKEHRLYVQDRCILVRQLNDLIKNRKLLIRLKVHDRKGIEKIENQIVPPHLIRQTFRKMNQVELRGLKTLEDVRLAPDLSYENIKLIEKATLLIETAKELLDSGLRRSKLLKPIIIQIEGGISA